jgi:hypothetical protein
MELCKLALISAKSANLAAWLKGAWPWRAHRWKLVHRYLALAQDGFILKPYYALRTEKIRKKVVN